MKKSKANEIIVFRYLRINKYIKRVGEQRKSTCRDAQSVCTLASRGEIYPS